MKSHSMAAALGLAALAAFGLAAIGPVVPAHAAEALGIWLTAAQDKVRIVNCGDALCGALVALKEPNDPATGKPKTDKNNPDATKQSRSLLGVEIVLGMKPNGANQWAGNVYNPEDGKTYTGSFTMTGANTAELKGCVAAIFCKAQTWTRSN